MHPFFRLPSLTAAMGTLLVLGGCVATQPTLYRWDTYESQIYGHFKGEAPEPQIARLEEQRQKAAAESKAVPPGFNAHLGLLYSKVGNADAAQQCFVNEKAQFPESATFMDRLLAKFKTPGERP
jgi:hypothetical protein